MSAVSVPHASGRPADPSLPRLLTAMAKTPCAASRRMVPSSISRDPGYPPCWQITTGALRTCGS